MATSSNRPFRIPARIRPDRKGRITLGRIAENVSSYAVRVNPDGRIILEPYAEVPAGERWLYDSPTARSRGPRGLADAASGRVRSAGSFARHVKDDD